MKCQSELGFCEVQPHRKVTGYNTLTDVNDHALSFVWLTQIITIHENPNFQVLIVELCFSLSGHSTSVP